MKPPGLKKVSLVFVLVAVLLLALPVGCRFSGDENEFEIKNAPIHDVQVNFAESFPVQVFVYIKGGLADGCTTFNEVTTERDGDTITITGNGHAFDKW